MEVTRQRLELTIACCEFISADEQFQPLREG
jgi:hypothetical protein